MFDVARSTGRTLCEVERARKIKRMTAAEEGLVNLLAERVKVWQRTCQSCHAQGSCLSTCELCLGSVPRKSNVPPQTIRVAFLERLSSIWRHVRTIAAQATHIRKRIESWCQSRRGLQNKNQIHQASHRMPIKQKVKPRAGFAKSNSRTETHFIPRELCVTQGEVCQEGFPSTIDATNRC